MENTTQNPAAEEAYAAAVEGYAAYGRLIVAYRDQSRVHDLTISFLNQLLREGRIDRAAFTRGMGENDADWIAARDAMQAADPTALRVELRRAARAAGRPCPDMPY